MITIIYTVLAFSACNKNDDGPTKDPVEETITPPEEETVTPPTVLTGVFRDSEVQGLSFTTPTQTGTTNINGEFSYVEGETITFKVGELTLGSAPAAAVMTPISLAKSIDAAASIESKTVQNMAALLQTLDQDGNHGNGISISQEVVAAMGIQTIDFSQPVESVLADIVLNVAQNEGTALQITYPGQAANNMAAALNIEYAAPPNFTISHLLPTLKAFLESYYWGHTPVSAVYKSSFDTEGKLLGLDVISRYSGNFLLSFTFSGHDADNQPTSGSYTRYNANRRFGSSSANATFNYGLELAYNEDHRLIEFGESVNGQVVNLTEFTVFDPDNRPLSYFRDLAQEGVDETFVITIDATYENGLINTSSRNFYREYNEGNNITNTTRELTYRYNNRNNLTNIDFTRVFEDTFTQNDGEVINTINQGNHNETFTYDNAHKLVRYQSLEQATFDNGDMYTQEWTREYDTNELLQSYTFSSTLNRESVAVYEAGIQLSSQDFFDGRLTFETNYSSDGTSTFTNYFYDENGVLNRVELFERDATFRTVRRTDTFYVEGQIDYIYNYVYDVNGYVERIEAVFADGTPWFTEEWEHDANGILERVSVYLSDGSLFAIYFYENGQLVAGEFYENGVLVETIDYTASGKSRIDVSKTRKPFKDGNHLTPKVPSHKNNLNTKTQSKFTIRPLILHSVDNLK